MSLHDLVKVVGNAEAIKEKIVTGANVDEIDKLRRTPVHMASWSGNLEALQLLVRANANLGAKAMDGFTPLHFAAQSVSPEAPACIRFLVKKNKGLLNQRITKGNKSALHLAASKGSVPNVTTLLELGADMTAKTTSGQTAAELSKTPEVKALFTSFTAQKVGDMDDACSEDSEESGDEGEAETEKEGAAGAHAVATAAMQVSSKAQGDSTTSKKRPISEVVTDE